MKEAIDRAQKSSKEYEQEHDESVSLVTHMNEEFETINVLKTFYIIKRYLEERDKIGT